METATKLLLLFLVLIIIGTGVGLALYFLVFKKCKPGDCKKSDQSCNPNGKCVAKDDSCKGDNDCVGGQTCSKDGKCTDSSAAGPTGGPPPSNGNGGTSSKCSGRCTPGDKCYDDKHDKQYLCTPGLYADTDKVLKESGTWSPMGAFDIKNKCKQTGNTFPGIHYCPVKPCQNEKGIDGKNSYTCENRSYQYYDPDKDIKSYCIPDPKNNLLCWVDDKSGSADHYPKNWSHKKSDNNNGNDNDSCPPKVKKCPGHTCKCPGQICITDDGGQYLCVPKLVNDKAQYRSTDYVWEGNTNRIDLTQGKGCTPQPTPHNLSGVNYCPFSCKGAVAINGPDPDKSPSYQCLDKPYKIYGNDGLVYCIPDKSKNLACWVATGDMTTNVFYPPNWTDKKDDETIKNDKST